ncbi:SusE domain-containing protein [Persicobacter sp. CCB-QB2]|uniref:SusE domain-containing protein n=1 Tax=Persicobacter sp. CCB-QB2 TaxID=1561025 RepID=UPI0006A9D516|nr:SusE domain-containing protein [Persicobacter sp. CCB-QB2]
MKKNFLNIFIFLGVLTTWSCSPEKELTKIVEDSTVGAPKLDKSFEGSSIVLSRETQGDEALKVEWSEISYDQSVVLNYVVEMAVAGTDFAETRALGITTDNFVSLTHGQLNVEALGLGLPSEQASDVEIRVTTQLNHQTERKVSEVVGFSVSPYSTIFPSIYMIGEAVGGWDPNKAVEVANKGEENIYETIAYFASSDYPYFRFFTAPDWGSNLGGVDVFTNYPTDLLAPQPGANEDSNFTFLGESGYYFLKVDRNTGTIEMEAVSEPILYLTGDAVHGWNWDSTTELKWVGHEIWEGEVTFNQDGAFRCFEQKDWGLLVMDGTF